MKEPNKEVTIVFACREKHSVDFKIRIKYDGLTQKIFFEEVLKMYISGEPEMMTVVEKIKFNKRAMGKSKITRAAKELKEGQKLLSDLSLTASERDALFDLIEEKGGSYD